MPIPWNPNGAPWHEPRCPACKRFDADCACAWPMPPDAPTTPPDDEALEVPAK